MKNYWAKIDVQKPYIPRTPRPVTPKPKQKKKKDVGCDSESVIEKPTSRRVLDFEESKGLSTERCCNEAVLSSSNVSAGTAQMPVRVYRRKYMCLTSCHKIVQEGVGICRKKRMRRRRLSIQKCRMFKGFTNGNVMEDLLDRILRMRGRLKMLLHTQDNLNRIERDHYACVLSLLYSQTMTRKKKRARRVQKAINNVLHSSPPSSTPLHPLIEAIQESKNELENRRVNEEEKTSGRKVRIGNRKMDTEEEMKGGGRSKEDNRRKGTGKNGEGEIGKGRQDKGKRKEKDSLMIICWEDPNAEEAKLKREQAELFAKIDNFMTVTNFFQGPKDFKKWNGSVLDSIVGVFLTQNVSDVLSSHCFLELISRYPLKPQEKEDVIVEHPDEDEDEATCCNHNTESSEEFNDTLKELMASLRKFQEEKRNKKGKKADQEKFNWEPIRRLFAQNTQRTRKTQDSVDWEAVRKATVDDIAKTIEKRGQQYLIAGKIKRMLNDLVENHGTLDVEWLRKAPPEIAKAYLLDIFGLGPKSVDCLRLLTLDFHGFPVDVNIRRIAIRLGWVPIKPLPPEIPFHRLDNYPLEAEQQAYLEPRLSDMPQELKYALHCQCICFGKCFCTKRSPNCFACPMKHVCIYYASLMESRSRLALDDGRKKSRKTSKMNQIAHSSVGWNGRSPNSDFLSAPTIRECSESALTSDISSCSQESCTCHMNVSENSTYIVDVPFSPEARPVESEPEIPDMEDFGLDCTHEERYQPESQNSFDDEFIEIDCTQDDQQWEINQYEENVNNDLSDALVLQRLFAVPNQRVARLSTKHLVYELPDNHPIVRQLHLETQVKDKPYLLAIWNPDRLKNGTIEECASSSQSAGPFTNVSGEAKTIPATLLIPCERATRGSFPLNGTYFQKNEVFADFTTSERPLNVPRAWIGNLRRQILYCGSSMSTIVKGLTSEFQIQKCLRDGFICVRGFDRETRAPKDLPQIFHFRKVKETEALDPDR